MLLGVFLALAAGQVRLDAQAGARVETRARTPTIADTASTQAAGDAEVSPLLQAWLRDGGGLITLTYAPTLRVREPYATTRRWEFNQRESLYAQWFREGRPRPYLAQSFTYGLTDIASLYGTFESGTGTGPGGSVPGGAAPPANAAVPVQTVLISGLVKDVTFDVSNGVAWPLTKTVMLDTSAGFFYGGGVDTASRAVLPEQYSARGAAKLEAQLSELTAVLSQVNALYARFLRPSDSLPMSQFTIADLTLKLRRKFLPAVTFTAGGGGAVIAGWANAGAQSEPSAAPLGTAQLDVVASSGKHAVEFTGNVGVAPFVDRFLATAYPRADAASGVTYTYLGQWQLRGRGGIGRSLGAVVTPELGQFTDLTTFYVEGRVGYLPPRFWRIEAYALDSMVLVGALRVNNWVAGLSLTVETVTR